MTNYLDKDGLKKFWDITKGKYSPLGHTHAFSELTGKPTTCAGVGITDAITTGNIGSQSVANANKLNGLSSSDFTRRYVWTAQFKGKTWSRLFIAKSNDAIVGMSFIMNLTYTRSGVVVNDTFLVTFTHDNRTSIVKLNATSYEGITTWNIRGVVDVNASFGAIEIYDTALSDTSYDNVTVSLDIIRDCNITMYTSFVGGQTDGVASALVINRKYQMQCRSILTSGDITLSNGAVTAQRSDGNESGVTSKNNNGEVRLIVHDNRGVYDITGNHWLVGVNKANNHTMMMQGNVGINTMTPDSRLHVNGTIHATGAATLDSTLAVKGTTTLNGDVTAQGSLKVNGNVSTKSISINGTILDNAYSHIEIQTEDTNMPEFLAAMSDSSGDYLSGVGIVCDGSIVTLNDAGDNIIFKGTTLEIYKVSGDDSELKGMITIPEKTGTIALDTDLAKYFPLTGGTITGVLMVNGETIINNTLKVKGDTNAENLTVNGVLTTKGNGVELYHNTPFIDFHYGNSSKDYDVRIWNNVSGGLQINAPTLIDLVGPMKSSGGRLWITKGNTNIYDVTTSMLTSYVKAKHLLTSWFVGNVGIGTDADSAYKLKVNGKAYVSGNAIVNGDLQVNGIIDNGDFRTDGDGWVYTTQLNINDGGDLVIYDSDGNEHILNLTKAIELGVFS